MAAVSAEFPLGQVFEIAGPVVTARCTSVCRTWREAADEPHVWRVHVEITCGRAVATALDELRGEGRTSLTFKELIIKRWRSNHITAASAYTWTPVAPFRADSTQNERDERKEQLTERFHVVLLEASLVHRQTGARMAFVTVPMDETHIRRLFASSVPLATSGVSFPSSALSGFDSTNDCSIVLTLHDLSEAHVAKIMTAHFVEPAYMADGVRNFVSYDMETVVCDMSWPKGRTTASMPEAEVATWLMPLWPGDHTVETLRETLIAAMIENIMADPTRHHATLRLHPVLMVAEDPPSIRLRFHFMYWEEQDWENEGDGMQQVRGPMALDIKCLMENPPPAPVLTATGVQYRTRAEAVGSTSRGPGCVGVKAFTT